MYKRNNRPLAENSANLVTLYLVRLCTELSPKQGDQIGRIFAYCAIVLLVHFLKIAEVAQHFLLLVIVMF
jgi:hypothetical protein